MTKTVDEAKADLLTVIPYIRHAIALANSKGTARLGILCQFPDGSGKIEARFDAYFMENVALVIGAPDQTEEDTLNAEAQEIKDIIARG